MAPVLVTTYTQALGRFPTSLSSGAFTPDVGEVIVVKLGAENALTIPGAPTATGLTFTKRAEVGAGAGGAQTYAAIYTAVVSTSQSYTITSSFTGGSASHSWVIERWSNAQLAATPATGTAAQSTTDSATISTTAANSVVSWATFDWNAVTYTTRTYRSSATEEFVAGTSGTDYFAAFAYQSAATAGSQTFGMTQPTGQQASMVGIEIQDGGTSGNTFVANPAESIGLTDAIQVQTAPQSSATLYGSSATTGGAATWTNAANANGAPDATVATWTNATAGATGNLDLSFDFSSLVPSTATIVSVAVTVRAAVGNTTRMAAPTSQVFIGGTGVGTASTLALATALTDTTYNPTLTLAQVRDSTFKVRVNANKASGNAQSSTTTIDGVTVVVNYTAPSSNYGSTPGDNAGIADAVSTTMSGQIASSPADSVGATDALTAVKAVAFTVTDAASGSDTPSVAFQGNVSSTPSESVGLTDSVSAVLTPGGGGSSVNIELLAQYAGAASTSHTITLSHAPNLNTLYVWATSHGVMTIDGGTGGWTQLDGFVNGIDYKWWKLDNPSTSKTTVTITHSAAVELAAVVFQAHVDSAGTPYLAPRTQQLSGRIGTTSVGTNLHTYSGESASLAVFNTSGLSNALDSAMDITSYDQGFTEFADSGMSRSSFGDSRLWIGINQSTGSLSNSGVQGFVTGTTWDSDSDSYGGMIALPLLPAPAAGAQNYTKTISDSAGATDAVTPNFNGSIPALASDTANVTDSVTAAISGTASVNYELLSSYNGAAAGTHTITLSHAPNLNSLWVFANSHGLMTIDGGTGGWTQVVTSVNNIDYEIWRLDNPSTSKTTITFSHYNGNAVELAAVVWQMHLDGTGTPYQAARQNFLVDRVGLTTVGTGLHTYSGETISFALFNACGNSGVLSPSMDITSWDSGFTEFADTGLSTSTYGDSRIWMAVSDTTGSMSNNGVVGTVTGTTWNTDADAFGGMLAFKLLPAPAPTAQNYVKNISDSAGATDSMTPNFNGSIPVLANDNAGITDSVTAQRVTPASTNLQVLAQYSNGATAATTHTITFNQAPTLNTLYLIAMSSGMMTVDGGTGGWVNVASTVNSTDQKIWRLDNPSSSKTSITITSASAVSVAAIVFQAQVDANIAPYINPYVSPLNGRNGLTSISTGLHTYSGQTASIAYYSINGNYNAISASQDLTSFDRSFGSFAKTGIGRSSFGDVGLWLAVEKSTGSISNGGVTATTAIAWDSGADSYGGVLALNLLPVSGGTTWNPSDTANITDSVQVLVNGQQASPTIYQENYNTPTVGVVQSDNFWLQGVSQTGIPGFARSTYYLPGQTAQFSVGYNTAFNVEIWRMGAYPSQTHGAHKVATVAGTGAVQPSPTTIPNSNGAVDYTNWSVNANWTIPNDATPGWYYALFRGQAVTSDLGFYLFCVSDKNAKKPLLVVSSDSTWHGAYNTYGPGNKSLYGSGGPIGGTGGITDRALAASLNRPLDTRLSVPQTFWMNSEMPFLRFLERFGYEAGHATNEQVENDPTILDGRTCIVFIGHNEYISQPYWDKIASLQTSTATNIINLAANDFYWRVRYGTTDSTDKVTKGRVIWCHKDTMDGPGTHVGGTQYDAAEWLGTWQDTRWAGRRVIANLFADMFQVNGVRSDEIFVPDTMKSLPLWRNCTRVQALASGASLGLGAGTLGMEWDVVGTVGAPPTTKLSSTDVVISSGLADANGQNYSDSGTAHHAFQIMRNSGGGYTFTGSTTQWSWALDDFHDRGTLVANADAMQATINLLADFGIMPVAAPVSAASLTYPTPVSDVGTAYAIPASSGTNTSKSQADNAGATDSVSVTHDYVVTIGDSAGVTDSTITALAETISIGDSAGITDSATGWTEYLKTADDSAGVTDAIAVANSFVETQPDQATITDSVSITYQGQISQSPSDIANGTDVVTSDLARLFTQGPNDQANLTDSVTIDWARVLQVSLTESIGASDFDTLMDEELFADNAGITDTTSIVKAINAALTDSVGGADVLTSSYQSNVVQNLADNAGISDAVSLLKAITKSQSDAANLSDAIALVRAIPKTLTESIGLTDSVSAVKNANASFYVLAAGNIETPITLQGWWSGTAIVPLTYNQIT